MNCIVTAGPTYENLDQVRRLTNFSTGQLGSRLAGYLAARGHHVILLKGVASVHQAEVGAQESIPFTTTADLTERLESLASRPVDAVFHAAAVSDFRFGRVFERTDLGDLLELNSGKLSTRRGPLLAELVPTPKIIANLRLWYAHALLVGWKYEVDGTQNDAIQTGRRQMEGSRTDACVVNGPAYGLGFGFLRKETECQHMPDVQHLFDALAEFIEKCQPAARPV